MAFRLQWSFRRGLMDTTTKTASEAQLEHIELHNIKARRNVRIFDSFDRELTYRELAELVVAERGELPHA